jgi:hypothetical protein
MFRCLIVQIPNVSLTLKILAVLTLLKILISAIREISGLGKI